MNTATGDLVNSWVDHVADWLRQPFKPEGSALNWLFFLLLVIVGLGFWQLVIIDITRD